MKQIHKRKFLLLLPFLAILAGYHLFIHRETDTEAPVISLPPSTLTVSVQDGQEALLSGATAVDGLDGDVTGQMVVEHIGALKQDRTALVTLAAFDRAGNVSKANRTVCFEDYNGMTFHLSAPLVFPEDHNFNLLHCISVTDPIDGSLSSRIKASLTGDDTTIRTVGVHEVALRVTNSMGYTERLTVPVEVCAPGTYNASVKLSRYLVYLRTGDDFNPYDYPQALVPDARTEYSLEGGGSDDTSLLIESNVDTGVPGTYTVHYTAEHNNHIGMATLIVVVED